MSIVADLLLIALFTWECFSYRLAYNFDACVPVFEVWFSFFYPLLPLM